MHWKQADHKEDNTYVLPGDWLKIEYFEAINILFRIENSLRVFVFIILKNEFKEKWKDLSVTSDDEEKSTIGSIAKKRVAQDMNYAYLGYIINSPLLHLTSGELIRIITSESYWKLFKPYFLGNKEIMKNKLDEIGNVRNSVAHFRPIKKGDVELIKQNSIHTLSQIEKTLEDFINCPDVVPTNTEELWYKELIELVSKECKISFKQSKDEKWIKLILSFHCPIISKTNVLKIFRVTSFNLKTDDLLVHYPKLGGYTICITEDLPRSSYYNFEELEPIKNIRFTFSRRSLEENYKEIKVDLEKILLDISNELTLIKQDNLARGKIIESIGVNVQKSDELLQINSEIYKTELDEKSPVEFWGTLNFTFGDFITNTERFPWMPVDISEDDLPF